MLVDVLTVVLVNPNVQLEQSARAMEFVLSMQELVLTAVHVQAFAPQM